MIGVKERISCRDAYPLVEKFNFGYDERGFKRPEVGVLSLAKTVRNVLLYEVVVTGLPEMSMNDIMGITWDYQKWEAVGRFQGKVIHYCTWLLYEEGDGRRDLTAMRCSLREKWREDTKYHKDESGNIDYSNPVIVGGESVVERSELTPGVFEITDINRDRVADVLIEPVIQFTLVVDWG
jgi:hypothetical protein